MSVSTTNQETGGITIKMTEDEMAAEIIRLKKEIAERETKRSPKLSFKVSEKGALSVYGLGRFPVTLYKKQWLKLIEVVVDITAFIKLHNNELKDAKTAA